VWLDAAAGVAARLHPHLARYHIREDLEFIDAGAERRTLLLAGPGAADWLAARVDGTLPTALLAPAEMRLAGETAAVLALDWFGPGGFLVQSSAAAAERLAASFRSAGLAELEPAAVDAARIAAGSPEPADIDDRTLPQELGRDNRAISFTKGCYLGQETVARIDALGHVNRRFVILATAAPPAVGAAVTAAGEIVGRITSACANPAGGLGLALVHVKGLAGAALEIDGFLARVVTGNATRQEA
jgi:folate-binding protein YgfZ